MLTYPRLAIVACALGAQVLIAPVVLAGCPSGCSCWTEDGVSKMACSAGPTASATASKGSTKSEGAAAEVAAATPDPNERWLTQEERRARLEERQRDLDRRILEVQRARFEARARGESEETLAKFDKDFDSIQGQRRTTLKQIRSLGEN